MGYFEDEPERREMIVEPEHIKLLRGLHWRWNSGNSGYAGGPYVDSLHPYGSGQAVWLAAQLLGLDHLTEHVQARYLTGKVLVLREDVQRRIDRWHRELGLALEICISAGSFEPGEYRYNDSLARPAWERVTLGSAGRPPRGPSRHSPLRSSGDREDGLPAGDTPHGKEAPRE